jgi:hypothetical protein
LSRRGERGGAPDAAVGPEFAAIEDESAAVDVEEALFVLFIETPSCVL